MRAVLQRVSEAKVTIENTVVAEIGPGLLILLAIGREDSEETCRQLAMRSARLRIFDDEGGRMNLSLIDTRGSALVVSQFTLYADTSRGLRPSFADACPPGRARELCDRFTSELSCLGVPVRTGRFGARMAVQLVNEGPVTIVLEEPDRQAGPC